MSSGELILILIGSIAIIGAISTLIIYGNYMRKHSVSQKSIIYKEKSPLEEVKKSEIVIERIDEIEKRFEFEIKRTRDMLDSFRKENSVKFEILSSFQKSLMGLEVLPDKNEVTIEEVAKYTIQELYLDKERKKQTKRPARGIRHTEKIKFKSGPTYIVKVGEESDFSITPAFTIQESTVENIKGKKDEKKD